MLKVRVVFLFCFSSLTLCAQVDSVSRLEYQRYLERKTYDLIMNAFTDSVIVTGAVEFSDYNVIEKTDSIVAIGLEGKRQLIISRKVEGWVIRGYRKDKKDGLWVFSQPKGLLIERWEKGVIKTRRWLLDTDE